SYVNTLEVIETCSAYLADNYGKKRPVFGGLKLNALAPAERKEKAALLAPVLRGFCSSYNRMVGHFTDDERVLDFINSNDLEKLAPMGTSCPDHFLRTKISPMILSLKPEDDLTNIAAVKEKLAPQFSAYRKMYTE